MRKIHEAMLMLPKMPEMASSSGMLSLPSAATAARVGGTPIAVAAGEGKKCNSARAAMAAGCKLRLPSEVEAEKSRVYFRNRIPPRGTQAGRIVFCRNENRLLGGQVEVSRDQNWQRRRRQQAVQSYGFPSLLSAFRGADLAKTALPLADSGRRGGLVVTHTLPASGRRVDGWVERHKILSATPQTAQRGWLPCCPVRSLQSSCMQLRICGCEMMCGAGPCPATCWAADGQFQNVVILWLARATQHQLTLEQD